MAQPVGLSVGDCLNGVGKPSPMWAAPFPRKEVLNHARVEDRTEHNKYSCIRLSLPLTMGAM